MRILLVDDEVVLARTAARLLREHTVTVAHSVAEAIGALENNVFDIVITDVMMPGSTGPALHRWIVGNQPHLASRVLFTSGGMMPAEADYIKSTGLPLLAKPEGFVRLREHLLVMGSELGASE